MDVEDFEILSKLSWWSDAKRATTKIDGVRYLMHRVINQTPDGLDTDHIDGNPLNNTRRNLRTCSHSDNVKNRAIHKNNRSGYKGVYFSKRDKAWRSQIRVNGKKIDLGSFRSPQEAHTAYCTASKKMYGDFARLNNADIVRLRCSEI